MKIKNQFAATFLLSVLLCSQGCATIISGTKQKVTVTSTPDGADILLDGTKVGVTPAKIKVPRKTGGLIQVEKKGYFEQSEQITSNKLNPVVLANIPFSPLLLMTWFTDFNTGAAKKLDKNSLNFSLPPGPQKIEGAYMTFCSELIIKAKAGEKLGDYKIKNYPAGDKPIYFEESFKVDAVGVRTTLNEKLKELGFKIPEAKGQLFAPSSQAHYLIKGEIMSIKYDVIASSQVQMQGVAGETNIKVETMSVATIKWQLLNRNNELKHEATITKKLIKNECTVVTAVNELVERSFDEFLAQEQVYPIVKQPYNPEDIAKKFELLQINQPAAFADDDKIINNATNSIVTIDNGDSHGSGCVISEDGYIVTNYHVVEGLEKVTVKFKNGFSLDGTVVRNNQDFDLALIKVNGSGFSPIRMSTEKDINVGADVFAIGTPADKNLGQTVTKGIISGVRKNEEREFIQTDVSINPGNSGGGLINKKGVLVGVVNAKLVGGAIEGIGFAIPSYFIFEKLKIAYK